MAASRSASSRRLPASRLPERGLQGQRAKRRPQRYKAILTSAATRFHRDGYHATSMDDIAADVELSTTALYRHFANKQAILDTAASWIGDEIYDRLTRQAGESPTLDELVDELVDLTLAEPHFVGLFVRELHTVSEHVRAQLLRQRRDFLAVWRDALLAEQPGLDNADATLRVALVMSLIQSVTSGHLPARVDVRRIVTATALGALRN